MGQVAPTKALEVSPLVEEIIPSEEAQEVREDQKKEDAPEGVT